MEQTPSTRREAKNFDQLYPGRFLKAGEFNGKKVTLTIADAFVEDLEGEQGVKPKAIVAFKETPKALVACKTNGLCFKGMFGPEIANWVGKRVTLFPDVWNGEPCIRVFGSPDIAEPVSVEIKLPKRRPFVKTMQPTGKKASAAAPTTDTPAREPGAD
jgi:hypothetical protein